MRIASVKPKKSSDWVLQFINIVFLILLFFMVNGVIAPPSQPGILPPLAIYSDAASPPRNALFIDLDGQLSFAGHHLSVAAFEDLLRQTRGSKDAPSAIVADRRLSATFLINILSGLQSKGLPALPLVTLRDQP